MYRTVTKTSSKGNSCLDDFEAKIRRKAEEHKSAANEERTRREAEEDKTGNGGGGAYRPPVSLSANEERIRRKVEEDKKRGSKGHQPPSASSAVNEERMDEFHEKIRRKMKVDSGGGNGDNGGSERVSEERMGEFQEKIRRKVKVDGGGGNGDNGGSERVSEERMGEFQEKIRRKMKMDSGGGNGDIGGSEHGKAEPRKAEPRKARRTITREDRCASMPISTSSAVNELEEKIRRKLEKDGGGGDGGNGGSKPGEAKQAKARRTITREDRSATMPISSPSSVVNDFDAKIRRKLLEGAAGGGSGGVGGSEHRRAMRRFKRENSCKSMPSTVTEFGRDGSDGSGDNVGSEQGKAERDKAGRRLKRGDRRASLPTPNLSSAVNEFQENIRRKQEGDTSGGENGGSKHEEADDGKTGRRFNLGDVVSSALREDHSAHIPPPSLVDDPAEDNDNLQPAHASSSTPALYEGIGDGAKTPPATLDKEAHSGASGVGFEKIFGHLQRYKEENGSLSIPVSHPFFAHILDTLSSVGIEESLRRHWDQRLVGLAAFKEKYGDCLVPKVHSTLGRWARIQRDHYVLYARRVDSPLTRERFEKLKDLGFDEFVSWEGNNKEQDPNSDEGSIVSTSLESEEEEASYDPHNLTLNRKSEAGKMQNKAKFLERTMVAHGKAAVAEELHIKRILQANSRRGLSEENGAGDSDGGTAASPENGDGDAGRGGWAGSLLVSSRSNSRRPGSWECAKCTYINAPAGIGEEVKACAACGAWECMRCTYVNQATSSHCVACNDLREDWEEDDGVLHEVMEQSMNDLTTRKDKPSIVGPARRLINIRRLMDRSGYGDIDKPETEKRTKKKRRKKKKKKEGKSTELRATVM